MAALALTLGGAALGSSLLPGGVSAFGATLSGASIGGVVGGIVGSFADGALFGQDAPRQRGPRLADLPVQASTEGAAIARVFGRFRVGPQVIWAADIREERRRSTRGGKGAAGVPVTDYRYFATLALGLCEGPIAGIGRIWADGKLVDAGGIDYRLYRGTEAQAPDPRIEAEEGGGNAPAYRGLAYMVLEDLPLEPWGNRIPQFTVEVAAAAAGPGLKAITLIPGAGEFVYETRKVHAAGRFGAGEPENVHADPGRADVLVALDQLAEQLPSVRNVALVVSWHGDDLRCGSCDIRPKAENAAKQTRGAEWRVSGVTRNGAAIVSQVDGRPALGGTPSDASVRRLIGELKRRGHAVTLYPFLLMDIPHGNGLPDPYGGAAQPAYPWRGRITCHPAPGRPGTPDGSAAAGNQVGAFFGQALPAHFAWNGEAETVDYGGPAEWGFRRLVLHYARLAEAAGGVDAFLVGSELVGLTTVRSAADGYPAVAALKALARDVRSILGGGTKLGYAADWTEYGPHRPDDGSGDLFFHLDPLFADAAIDFVGIDAYFPLSDWRAGRNHLDAKAGTQSPYDLGYLRRNIEGGELFDWFYRSAADRAAQARTPITDGAYGEPWVHRIKDIRSWWSNAHHDRPGGVRRAAQTAWVPKSKPIWFTEFGCPAVHLGPNQPNVFVDPKSSESLVPYFSGGHRDDAAQHAYHKTVLSYWGDPANNPDSPHYPGRMLDPDRFYAWTWDARPFPDFPQRRQVWSDAGNWTLGHWLTGRAAGGGADDIVAAIAGAAGIEIAAGRLGGIVKGYLVDRIMSARDALEPLLATLAVDATEVDGVICFTPRGAASVATFTAEQLVAAREGPDFKLTRGQESELPLGIKLSFTDAGADYQQATVESRRLTGSALRIGEIALPVALAQDEALRIAQRLLMEAHAGRERAEIVLPPSALTLDPGDVIALAVNGRHTLFRIDAIGFDLGRPAKLTRTDPDIYG